MKIAALQLFHGHAHGRGFLDLQCDLLRKRSPHEEGTRAVLEKSGSERVIGWCRHMPLSPGNVTFLDRGSKGRTKAAGQSYTKWRVLGDPQTIHNSPRLSRNQGGPLNSPGSLRRACYHATIRAARTCIVSPSEAFF